jgi:predicted MFS family arabinose efflux permease
MGCYAVALLAVRAAMPYLVRHSSEERVLSFSLFLAAAVCVGFPFASGYPALLGMTFVIGLALGCGGPISLVLAYNRSPPGRSGEGVGLRQTVNKATEVVVPMIFGSVSAALGMLPVFWLDALMLAYGGLLMRADADGKSAPAAPEAPGGPPPGDRGG